MACPNLQEQVLHLYVEVLTLSLIMERFSGPKRCCEVLEEESRCSGWPADSATCWEKGGGGDFEARAAASRLSSKYVTVAHRGEEVHAQEDKE